MGVRFAGGLLAVCTLVACSGPTASQSAHPGAQDSTHRSPKASVGPHSAFAAFEPGRHDQLLLVDPVTGHVVHATRAPGSEGYAANLRRSLWYLPVAAAAACRTAVDRVRFGSMRPDPGNATKIAVLDGGPVDSVDAQPALSADGAELAIVLDTQRTLMDPGAGATCGSTATIAVLNTRTHNVHYLVGRAGDQVDDLAWDHNNLIARLTPFQHSTTSAVEELDPTKTASYTHGRIVLREAHGRPGPVFRFHGCLAVITGGTIGCIRGGSIRLSHGLHPPTGLPATVERATVAGNGTDLLVQTPDGATYWWRDNTLHKIPVTVRGHWDEPTS